MSDRTSLPYPRGFLSRVLRLPLLLYRVGLGDLLNATLHIMVLGTRGRTSGLPRYTAIEYRRHGSKIYVVSAWGDQPQWFKNLQARPEVMVQAGRRGCKATATLVTNEGEALRVLHLFRRRAPFFYDPLIARLSERESINERTLPEVSKLFTIVRIDPEPGEPELPPLTPDYMWVWPALLVVGVVVMVAVLLTRQSGDG